GRVIKRWQATKYCPLDRISSNFVLNLDPEGSGRFLLQGAIYQPDMFRIPSHLRLRRYSQNYLQGFLGIRALRLGLPVGSALPSNPIPLCGDVARSSGPLV